MVHELKTLSPYYENVVSGRKTFEVRLNDRGFKVGDKLLLKEYEPVSNTYSGRESLFEIAYIVDLKRLWIINENIVVMSIIPV